MSSNATSFATELQFAGPSPHHRLLPVLSPSYYLDVLFEEIDEIPPQGGLPAQVQVLLSQQFIIEQFTDTFTDQVRSHPTPPASLRDTHPLTPNSTFLILELLGFCNNWVWVSVLHLLSIGQQWGESNLWCRPLRTTTQQQQVDPADGILALAEWHLLDFAVRTIPGQLSIILSLLLSLSLTHIRSLSLSQSPSSQQ